MRQLIPKKATQCSKDTTPKRVEDFKQERIIKNDKEIPNGGNSQNWVANMMFKFHNDPTVNESEIVIFMRQIWWPAGKREGFGRRREKK